MDYAGLFRAAPTRLLVLEAGADYRVAEASEEWLRCRRVERPAIVGRSVFEVLPEGSGARSLRVALGRVASSGIADERNTPVFAAGGAMAWIVHRDEEHQELEAFARWAAQDLRAPLQAITGYCALLRNLESGMPLPIGNDLLARMDASLGRMNGIVDRLSTLRQVESARLTRGRVDLAALARRIASDLQSQQPARTASVSIAERLEASADETLVSIALENLIGNAWKCTDARGEARIEVGHRVDEAGGVFFVSDNGFDMARAEKHLEGYAIKLATARRVVERHGGQVWAESRPGQGTTIH